MKNLFRSLRHYFINGLLLLAPFFFTLAILYKLFKTLYALMSSSLALIPAGYGEFPLIGPISTGGSIILSILFIWFLGLLIKSWLGRTVQKYFRRLIEALPVAGTIYRALWQIMDRLFGPSPLKHSRVVLVQFPFAEARALGFITGEAPESIMVLGADGTLKESYKVFIPGTPNPTGGFLVMVPKEDLIVTDLRAEEGFKSVISGGLLRQRGGRPGP